MKTKLLLIFLLLAVGCESKQTQTDPTAKDSSPPIRGVSFTGGDGSSIEKAIIIKAPNDFVGVRGEYDWIIKNLPGWQLQQQSSLKVEGRIYDKMVFLTPQGQRKTLYFDITNFYGKM